MEGQNGGGKLGERKPEQWTVLETKGREGLCGGKADIIKYMQGVVDRQSKRSMSRLRKIGSNIYPREAVWVTGT